MLRQTTLTTAVLAASFAQAEPSQLSPVVITAPQSDTVLLVTTDPKAPRQPIPAHDGADLLKNIPGFSVIRKGGTDGDPVFRGMAASRLGILLDGEQVLGGCGMRMDPPTAYVYPEAYDEVVVLKGPQTVQHAGMGSAGTVLFNRQRPQFDQAGIEGHASVLFASADRNDQVAGITAGNEKGYLRLNGTRADANNYEDGNGDEVHSAYNRWNADASLGWTPTLDSDIELSTARSDGEARYGDRGMDGIKFEREQHSLSYRVRAVSDLISEIEARVYQGYVDHVMDNFSLRPNSGMKMANNPDREITGAKLKSTLQPSATTEVNIGADWQSDDHSIRKASGMMAADYDAQSRMEDLSVRNYGIYAEWHQTLGDNALHAGLRVNKDKAEDKRMGRTTSGDTDNSTLKNAFIRFEQQQNNVRWYAGLGHAERAPDYWERMKNPAATSMMMTGSASTFDIEPERTTQLDTGVMYKTGKTQASVSAFYANHQDYILIETLPSVSMFASNARNIQATSWGAEADISHQLNDQWHSNATLAWVRGNNNSDNEALGQMPPLETRLALNYQKNRWSAGGVLRLVDEQNRVDPGKGNIVGQDLGQTPGFAVLSLNAAYKPMAKLTMSTGVDNLFDRSYAEHISRNGANITGYETTTRVNEPGRTFWLKAQWQFN